MKASLILSTIDLREWVGTVGKKFSWVLLWLLNMLSDGNGTSFKLLDS